MHLGPSRRLSACPCRGYIIEPLTTNTRSLDTLIALIMAGIDAPVVVMYYTHEIIKESCLRIRNPQSISPVYLSSAQFLLLAPSCLDGYMPNFVFGRYGIIVFKTHRPSVSFTIQE